MEALLGISAVLIVLAFPVAAIVALTMVVNLKTQVRAMAARLDTLEGAPRPQAATAAPAEASAAPEVAAEPVAARETAPVTPEPARDAAPAIAGTEPSAPEPPAPAAPAPASGLGDLEAKFGTRWVVWVGGLALALGGIFLVRYSIEAGLIGPLARVVMGGLFAAALIAGGEWMRRQDRDIGFAGVPSAYVPAVLTAAGTSTAYATVWAAYELYGFLSPAVAFVALGAVAVATIAAALLHGPALAALGTLAAFATPALVGTEDPDAMALFGFVAVVTAAAYAVARVRLWRWLVLWATGLAAAWGFLFAIEAPEKFGTAPLALHAAAGIGLLAALVVPGLLKGPAPVGRRVDFTSSGALLVYLAIAALFCVTTEMRTESVALVGAAAAMILACAWFAPAASPAVPASALVVAAVAFVWSVFPNLAATVAPGGAAQAPAPLPAIVSPMVAFVGLAGATYLGLGFLAIGRQKRGIVALLWAAAGAAMPVLMAAAAYYRLAGWVPSVPFGAIGLGVAAALAAAAEATLRRPRTPGSRACAAVFATGGLAALGVAFTMVLEKGWLTVALAFVALAAAYVAAQRPYPFLRWVAAIAGLVVVARIGWDPRIMGEDLGRTPIFNWLLWGYGVPALAFALAAHWLRRARDDWPVRVLESLSLLFAVLLVTMQVRHAMHDGDIYAADTGLAEVGLQTSVLAALAIGLERLRATTASIVHDVGAVAAFGLAAAAGLAGLAVVENPFLTNDPIGANPIVNRLLVAYALPALLFLALYALTATTRPAWHRAISGASALALGFVYQTGLVASLFRGERIGLMFAGTGPGETEWYAYSAAWLLLGLVLLAAGFVTGSKGARLASAVVITLTVLKVFLSDMADLEGALRAFSFIGLGLVLVGIGWLYQRLLIPRAAASAPAQGPPQTDPPPATPAAGQS